MDSDLASRLQRIRLEIGRLRGESASSRVFGAEAHRFRLAPPLGTTPLEAFERTHGIRIPEALRAFVSQVGNGGAGPDYGLLPIDRFAEDLEPVGAGYLAAAFPWSADTDLPPMEAFSDEEFCWQTRGSMRVSHQGCGYYVLLVVSGAERGTLWLDARVSDGGIVRLKDPDGNPLRFLEWYEAWLGAAIAETDR